MMIKSSFFIACALCFNSLYGVSDLEKKAKQLFEAKDYAGAISCYENLMKEPKRNFQKEILHYNIATAYLANQEYEKACKELSYILNDTDRYPLHLTQRALHNQLLSQIGWVNHLLAEKDPERGKQNLDQASTLIDQATRTLASYMEAKYNEKSEDQKKEEEVKELKNSIKELKSKWKKTHHDLILGELDFSKGIAKVKKQLQMQLETVEHYFESSFLHDFLKYALSREYQQAKKDVPYWNRLKELLDEKQQQAEWKAEQASSQEESEQILSEQKGYESFFNEALSGHQTALDCFKQHYLKRSWIELKKAMLGLSFIQQISEKKDLLKFCLHEKYEQFQKTSESLENETLLEANRESYHYLNEVALGFASQLESALDSQESKTDEAKFKHQILKKIRERLFLEQNPSEEKLLEDSALYDCLHESACSWLMPIYARLETQKAITEGEKKTFSPKLFALKERFEIEYALEKDHPHASQMKSVSTFLKKFEESWSKGEDQEAQKALEDLLINLDYPELVLYHLSAIDKMYTLAKRDIHFEPSYRKRIEDRKNRILSFPLHMEDPTQYEALYPQVKKELSPLSMFHDLAQNTAYRNQLQKLFLKNASYSVIRLQKKLKAEKLSSADVLAQGIEEQKLSLENCESTDHLLGVSQEDQDKYFKFAISSQHNPLEAVEPFEALFAQENQMQEPKEREETLKWFQAGLKEAQHAQEYLKAERICWEKVLQKQKKAIEYWQKALSSENGSGSSKNQEGSSGLGDSNPSQEDQDAEQENQKDQSLAQQCSLEESSAQQMKSEMRQEQLEEMAKEQDSRDLIQRLQDMQREDELTPSHQNKVKKGLRPW